VKKSNKLLLEWEQQHSPCFNTYKQKHPERTTTDNSFNEARLCIKRLREFIDAHLLFVTDFWINFDNNIAERSLWMTKTKLKVSGLFRSTQAMDSFFDACSVIKTIRNRNGYIFDTFIPMFSPIISSPWPSLFLVAFIFLLCSYECAKTN